MVTSRVIKAEVEGVLDYLVESEIALHVNTVSNELGSVSWRRFGSAERFLPNRGRPSTSDYRGWLVAGDYSAVLYDGALIQLTYQVDGAMLTTHRLAYVPPPFHMDVDMLQSFPLVDVFDLYAQGSTTDVVLSTVLRFDFDSAAAREGHPASHLTLNHPDCRIACIAPVRVGLFFEFVFRHFYYSLWRAHPFFGGLPKSGWGRVSATEGERQGIHMSWPH